MIKTIITAVVLVITIIPAKNVLAQASSATQMVKIHLEPTIQIMAPEKPNVNMGFNGINDYVQGIQSSEQHFSVHSNKDFVVNVRTNTDIFTYSGNANPAPQMPVSNILFLAITDNNTGGSTAGSFNSFTSLSSTTRNLLLNCKNGGNKTFAVNYKANPGTSFPAGDYTVDVIYTATQP